LLIFLTFVFHKVVSNAFQVIFNDNFISNFPESLTVKEFWKSVNI